MNFKDSDGKTWSDVLMAPPKEIDCGACDGKMIETCKKICSPPICCFVCQKCSREADIHTEYTRDHWPTDVYKRYQETMKGWAENGGGYELEGIAIFNMNDAKKFKPKEDSLGMVCKCGGREFEVDKTRFIGQQEAHESYKCKKCQQYQPESKT